MEWGRFEDDAAVGGAQIELVLDLTRLGFFLLQDEVECYGLCEIEDGKFLGRSLRSRLLFVYRVTRNDWRESPGL